MSLPVFVASAVGTATAPQGDDASLLCMPQHQTMLRIKSVNFDLAAGRPVEYALSRFRADRVQLRVTP